MTQRMHADEVATDAGLVRRLLAAQFPQRAELPIEPVPSSGTSNALYRVGHELVARLPRHASSIAPLEKERAWLPRLAPQLPLAVPKPVAEGRPAEGYPFTWSLFTWIDGEDATVARTDPRQLAHDLAVFLAALQAVGAADGPPPGPHNFGRGEPLRNRDEPVQAALQRVPAEGARELWAEALRAPEWHGAPVWVHGDLDARNLIVQHGRLTAVIDFGGLGVGDPAADVMVAWKLFAPDARRAFREALAVDDSTWARARGWVLSQALVALAYYTLETNPILVREAERWLAEVLSDDAR